MNLSAMNRAGRRSIGLQEREFSLSQARRALVYLHLVLADAVDAYQQAQTARSELACCCTREARVALSAQRDAAIARLNRTIDECHDVGVCMLNIAQGTLALKVREDDTLMCLIWRLGESVDGIWQSLEYVPQPRRELAYAARQG